MNTTDKKALATAGAEVQFYNQLTCCVETGIVRNVTEAICEVEGQRNNGVSLVRCLWDEIEMTMTETEMMEQINTWAKAWTEVKCPDCGATNEGVPPNADAVVQVVVDRHPVTRATRAMMTCTACHTCTELLPADEPEQPEPLFRDV